LDDYYSRRNACELDNPLTVGSSIWTIVVTHNSESVISTCLKSLEAATISSRIVVVDNGSKDATIDIVKRNFPSVIVCREANLGFAGGCNRGILLAGDDAEAYFFLNPDASVSSKCLEQLAKSLDENEGLAVVSPKILHPESKQIEYAGALLDFQNLSFGAFNSGEVHCGQTTQETGRPAGAAMLVRRSSLDTVGPMDASYFLYWEECEWAARFHSNGLKIGYVPDATVLHSLSHSTGGIGSKVYEYYYTRNLLRLVQEVKHLSRPATILHLLPLLSRRLRGILVSRQLILLTTIVRYRALGMWDFLRGRDGHRAGLP
jgi:GT2 family glycosyltransferase